VSRSESQPPATVRTPLLKFGPRQSRSEGKQPASHWGVTKRRGDDPTENKRQTRSLWRLPKVRMFVLVPVWLTMPTATPFLRCELEARECDYANHVRIRAGSARHIQQGLGVERAAAAAVPRAYPAPVAHRSSHGTNRLTIQSCFNPRATSPARRSIDHCRARYRAMTPADLERCASAGDGKHCRSAISRRVGVDARSVRHWEAGDRRMGDSLERVINILERHEDEWQDRRLSRGWRCLPISGPTREETISDETRSCRTYSVSGGANDACTYLDYFWFCLAGRRWTTCLCRE
jgi:hypothetical protein